MSDVIVFLLGGPQVTIAVYFRVSTEGQSIDHQRLAVQSWIAHRGLSGAPVAEYIDEAISGAYGAERRQGFADLIDAIKSRKILKCIMFETSRASRDFMDFLRFLELCTENHCEVEIVGAGVQNFTTSTDKLLASVQAFLGQAEREKIASRTKSGLAKARASGKVLGAPKGHQRNLGWSKAHSTQLIEEIRKYVLKDLSAREIADILGARFTKKPISYGTVRNIIIKYDLKAKSPKSA